MSPVPTGEAGPQSVDPSPLGRARSLAGSVTNTVRLSRALIGTGRRVDLAGLESVVGLLCAKALDLAGEQGKLLTPDLAALLEEIEILHCIVTAGPDDTT